LKCTLDTEIGPDGKIPNPLWHPSAHRYWQWWNLRAPLTCLGIWGSKNGNTSNVISEIANNIEKNRDLRHQIYLTAPEYINTTHDSMLGDFKVAIVAHARAQNQGPRVNKKTQKKVFDELVTGNVESDDEDLVSNIKQDLFTSKKTHPEREIQCLSILMPPFESNAGALAELRFELL
jgi:hypothetical protein